jgi:hypothetical protein
LYNKGVFQESQADFAVGGLHGYNENGVCGQIWTTQLTYILLCFIAWQSEDACSSRASIFASIQQMLN